MPSVFPGRACRRPGPTLLLTIAGYANLDLFGDTAKISTVSVSLVEVHFCAFREKIWAATPTSTVVRTIGVEDCWFAFTWRGNMAHRIVKNKLPTDLAAA